MCYEKWIYYSPLDLVKEISGGGDVDVVRVVEILKLEITQRVL